MGKQRDLVKAIKEFERVKSRCIADYMDLFVVVNRVLKQGSGLLWSDVVEAIDVALHGDKANIERELIEKLTK